MSGKNEYFRIRAEEELHRVRRYPSFVSLLSFDLSHINKRDEIENFESLEQFYIALRDLIAHSIRDTDLISDIYNGKIAILLVETPKEGVQALSSRLKKSVRYFLCNNTKSPANWRVPSREASFPDQNNDEDSFMSAVSEIN
jgi:GGDEF domain-containing protein